MGYSREECETNLNYSYETGKWTAYSTTPKHIRLLMKLVEDVTVLESEDGRPIAIQCELDEKQVGMRQKPKKRQMTEEQRQEAAERLAKSRSKK